MEYKNPNTPEEWEKVYLTEAEAVTEGTHPVTQVLLDITEDGDSLIETGCGGGEVSAELTLNSRKTHLLDFSHKILDKASKVYELSGLEPPGVTCLDMTQRVWAIEDNSFDVVWSAGVLEHWTDDEITPMVSEMARIGRKKVVSMIPNANSIFYRLGKDYSEKQGTWAFGRELPRYSLKTVFEDAGLKNIEEWDFLSEHSLTFLKSIDEKLFQVASDWYESLEHNEAVMKGQGYLLITVGYIEGVE